MTILIDGNNLIHKIPNLKLLFLKDKTASQKSLVETVNSRISKKLKIEIVFDGHGNFSRQGIYFSKNETADNIIRKKIENFKDHKKLKIVSSDNEITGFAKVCGCIVQKSEEFWKETVHSGSLPFGKNANPDIKVSEKPEHISRKELEEYKKLFLGKNINENFLYDKPEKTDRINKKGGDILSIKFT